MSATANKRAKSSVFNIRLNTGNDGDDVTTDGRLFQTHVAATGNALSPMVERFVRGTTSAAILADRSRHRESKSATSELIGEIGRARVRAGTGKREPPIGRRFAPVFAVSEGHAAAKLLIELARRTRQSCRRIQN